MTPDSSVHTERPLNGWKEIATYFGRNQSTVKRWAEERELPVRRLSGERGRKGSPVYAYPCELDDWLKSISQGLAADVIRSQGAAPAVLHIALPAPAGRMRSIGLPALLLVLAVLAGVLLWGRNSSAGLAVEARAPSPEAVSGEARELYLKGTYLWNKRTPEGIAGAIEALEAAIEREPDYADAFAALATTYTLAREYSVMSGREAYPKARAAAERAVALDPTLPLALSALGSVEFFWHRDVESGLGRFEAALEQDPFSANSWMWHASALLHLACPVQALASIETAQRLEPHSRAIVTLKAQAMFHNGNVTDAVALLREIEALEPDYASPHHFLGMIQAAQGDHLGYLRSYETLGGLIGSERHGRVAAAGRAGLSEGGFSAMIEAMIHTETEFYERGEALAWDIARLHGLSGDWRGAVRWLRASLEAREERLIGLLVDTAFWPIRSHPEFQSLAADAGLSGSAAAREQLCARAEPARSTQAGIEPAAARRGLLG